MKLLDEIMTVKFDCFQDLHFKWKDDKFGRWYGVLRGFTTVHCTFN